MDLLKWNIYQKAVHCKPLQGERSSCITWEDVSSAGRQRQNQTKKNPGQGMMASPVPGRVCHQTHTPGHPWVHQAAQLQRNTFTLLLFFEDLTLLLRCLLFFSCLLLLRQIYVGIWRKDSPGGSSAKTPCSFWTAPALGMPGALGCTTWCLLASWITRFCFVLERTVFHWKSVTTVFLRERVFSPLCSEGSCPALFPATI